MALVLILWTGAFDDDEVIHVDGEVNPVRDFETISEGECFMLNFLN